MGWLKDRKARKTLQKLGMSEVDISDMTTSLKQGHKDAIKMRDELRKKESKTYRKLIKQINDISYGPMSAKQKYDQSLAIIHEATLTEWEREDLLNQTESIYKEFLQASPYAQVLGMLNHIKTDNVTKIQKIDNSVKLIKSSDITEAQKKELLEQVNIVYGL